VIASVALLVTAFVQRSPRAAKKPNPQIRV